MKLTPQIAVENLESYVNENGYILGGYAQDVFREVEELCCKYDITLFARDFMLPLIKNVCKLRNLIDNGGGNTILATEWLNGEFQSAVGQRDKYNVESELYSSEGIFSSERKIMADKCMEIARRQHRKQIFEVDIVVAMLEVYEELSPIIENIDYTDTRLHTLYSTPCHLFAEYCEYLWIKNDFIVKQITLVDDKEYDIAISFAGEDRVFARDIAGLLSTSGITTFYDEYEMAKLWGKDLYLHLAEVYSKKARFCLILLSEHYAKSEWTILERKAAQEREFQENREYILPLRLDDTESSEMLPTIGYIDIRYIGVPMVVDLIKEKLSEYYSDCAKID